MPLKSVPAIRIRRLNDSPICSSSSFVLYWMIANRRTTWNFSFQRAIELAMELQKPLVILEALRCDYPWASQRLHHFILQGMADNARHLEQSPAYYYPYLESKKGSGKGLLQALSRQACVVVTDDFPAFFLPHMLSTAGRLLKVQLEAVDSNGLLPIRAADRAFPTAYAFRRFLQKTLPVHLAKRPTPNPLSGLLLKRLKQLPKEIQQRWPSASKQLLARSGPELGSFPINHQVPVVRLRGGTGEARKRLKRFLSKSLNEYSEKGNQPEAEATSGLSPYLHFGHISVHEIFSRLIEQQEWFFDKLSLRTSGSRSGWWGMSESAEAFLDQLVTWRELGFNMCHYRKDYDRFESLPAWALDTLRDHLGDKREHQYSLEEFELAATHDPLWNAAQGQLLSEGYIHNYLRMLWGKLILKWSVSPQQALKIMIEINNRYALDGRDPNSYSGIFWILGRYDRPWGPERAVFGKIRYMSSQNTARRLRVQNYIKKYTI